MGCKRDLWLLCRASLAGRDICPVPTRTKSKPQSCQHCTAANSASCCRLQLLRAVRKWGTVHVYGALNGGSDVTFKVRHHAGIILLETFGTDRGLYVPLEVCLASSNCGTLPRCHRGYTDSSKLPAITQAMYGSSGKCHAAAGCTHVQGTADAFQD